MSHRLQEERNCRDSDLNDYMYGYYEELKRDEVKIKTSHSTYRCPYCCARTDYQVKELLRHASRIGRDSTCKYVREKAKHLALERYINRYVDVKNPSEPSVKNQPEPAGKIKNQATCGNDQISIQNPSEPSVKNQPEPAGKIQNLAACGNDQIFVHPWKGILANIKTELKDGRHVGESGSKHRDDLASKGFNPIKVQPLWNRYGHSGFAVVDFSKEWDGFNNAMSFEKYFELNGHGKKDYDASRHRGEELYGWVARDRDYHSLGLIGEHLRKNGDLKTVSDKEAEDQRRTITLVSTLESALETKTQSLREMQKKYRETSASLNKVVEQKDDMLKKFNEERMKIQENDRNRWKKIFSDHDEASRRLESQKKELFMHEKKLQQLEAQNKNDWKKLQHEKILNEKAGLAQKKTDENLLKLAETQEKDKQILRKRIMELEKHLDEKQALELETERMRGALQVMEHMTEADDLEMTKKMDELKVELQEKEEELEDINQLTQALIVKERNSNQELQEARKELINVLKEQTNPRALVGVKRMGDLQVKPFLSVAKRMFPQEKVDKKAVMLCSEWDGYLHDPSWHPFKTIMNGGEAKEMIDEEDERIKRLKELGEEVYEAVTTALMDLNQYNPSGRYVLPELWNFQEGKKASLKEGVGHLLKRWKAVKRKK